MKFTSEDLMKAMGLQVGDKVKIVSGTSYEVVLDNKIGLYQIKGIENHGILLNLYSLLNVDFEILPRPKRVGDEYCKNIDCNKCPLRIIDCMDSAGDKMRDKTLYEILHYQNEVYPDKEIYDLLKARLDKVAK